MAWPDQGRQARRRREPGDRAALRHRFHPCAAPLQGRSGGGRRRRRGAEVADREAARAPCRSSGSGLSGMPARFVTDTGKEVPTVTAAQMREVDRIAIEETGPNLFQMMENAGSNLAAQALEALGERWREALVVVLAGPGRNGAGGICAARHLANHGVRVALCLSDPGGLGPAPALRGKT